MAEKFESKNQYQQAITCLDNAISKDKNFLGAYINRGADKSALGDIKGAIADYNKTIDLDPENTLALFNIANNYKRLNNFKLAVDYYNKAMQTKGGDGITFDYKPNNIFNLGKFDVPGREIRYERAIAFYHLDSLKKSFGDFKRCVSENYMLDDCYDWIGHIYFDTGNTVVACEFFNKSAQLGNVHAKDDLVKYFKN